MKNVAIALVASLFLFTFCSQKSEDGTHTHDDGSMHADHAADTTQEEFNAADTAGHVHDSTTHRHDH